jgi:hypothetical protein
MIILKYLCYDVLGISAFMSISAYDQPGFSKLKDEHVYDNIYIKLTVGKTYAVSKFNTIGGKKMAQKIKDVVVNPLINSTNEIALKNIDTIIEFFSLYLKDKEKFYSLWVATDPAVITPFVADDVAVCRQVELSGWDAVKSFWDPIFDMKGKFDWTIDEIIPGEDPNVIITKASSDIDADTTETFGNVHLKYNGKYLQVFKFIDGKVKSFEEYYDTNFLNKQFSK